MFVLGDGSPFEVSFIDPNRPDEPTPFLPLPRRLSSKHCEEGIRVELYRDDAMAVSSSGVVWIALGMRDATVCTIDLEPLESG
jgi:hypothetical protein